MSGPHTQLIPKPTPLEAVRSAALWGAGLCWIVPAMGAMMAASAVVHPDRTQWIDRTYCRVQVALTGSRWRAEVHPDVRPDRPYLFVQNHVNVLDHVTMYNATPHFKQGVELESHFRIPVYGWYMRRRGTIGIKRGDPDQRGDLLEKMRAEVALGHSILAFPEGTRTRDGSVGRFRRGMFYLARELGLPVVPTSVTGMYDVLRTGSWVMRPGDVTVYCDAPIETADVAREDIADLADRVRGIIAARVDAHRSRHG